MIVEIPDDNSNIKDLISREALIRAIKTECNPYGAPTIDYESGLRVLEIIERLPTVVPDCMEEDAKQASIPYTYSAPQHDWKCGYPDSTGCKKD